MRCAEVIAAGVVAVVAAGTVAGLVAGPVLAIGVVIVVLLATLGALGFARNRFRSWAYAERDEDLIVQRGVMIRRMSVVPYGRMQFVDVTAGPIDRIFRLATVKLHTAAAASGARIPGLERDEAARLRDRLAALGEAKAAGL
jgi:membrane protein YdbS with pleckstrin-like domain